MSLPPGARLGPYEIRDRIGAGGMGEVYRARDTKLDRDVAIKILPTSFAGDPERLKRFEREAKTLATLNHPHIAQIYGMEGAASAAGGGDDAWALVMELVPGEDLAQRIARGPIPIDEAIPIARQIAEALEGAHEQGVIHRDLKPANIKVRGDGAVKVLDFGLAKALAPAEAGTPMPLEGRGFGPATMTSPAMTAAGLILGTAAYMSPEQARGRTVDKRADIWAFGCVFFEMLSGARPFDGDDVAETIGAVIHKEPAWDRLPPPTPARIRAVLRACLAKDPKRRVRDIADVQLALEGAFDGASHTSVAAPMQRTRAAWRSVAVIVGATLIGAGITATAIWLTADRQAPAVSRFVITPGRQTSVTLLASDSTLAISRDGSRIAYIGNNASGLFVRLLDQLEPKNVVDAGLPRGPFFSPDGQWIGFFDAEPDQLRKVAVGGGPAIRVCTMDGSRRGGTWGPGDTIVFATSNEATGLWRVSAAGGDPRQLTKPNAEANEADHQFPEFLPDGKSVLFTILPASAKVDDVQLAVLDLERGTYKTILRGGVHGRYLPSGHLVYATAGTIMVVPFDLDRLETTGTGVPVLAHVAMARSSANLAVAANGTLVYVPSEASLAPRGVLVWVDRSGSEHPIDAPVRGYVSVRLSHDGKQIALGIGERGPESTEPALDIWIRDLVRGTERRLTLDAAQDVEPIWSPDGRRVFFASTRSVAGTTPLPGGTGETRPGRPDGRAANAGSGRTRFAIYAQFADGSGTPERLTEEASLAYPTSVSSDGRHLLVTEAAMGATSTSLILESFGANQQRQTVLHDSVDLYNGVLSPDGRWLAYEMARGGGTEVFVVPFPNVNAGRWQISTNGGRTPRWSRDGRELFYLTERSRDQNIDSMMAVPVVGGASWSTGTPTKLFERSIVNGSFDVSPDARRFLMIKDPNRSADGEPTQPRSLVIVQHWLEELKAQVPAK